MFSRGIMCVNVEKVIERDQKLSEVDDRAERTKLVHYFLSEL
jgi:hypothetical protein